MKKMLALVSAWAGSCLLCLGAEGLAGASGAEEVAPLRSPNGGEAWTADSQHYVTWDPLPASEKLQWEYTIDGGRSWVAIESPAGRQGNRCLWKVPNRPSSSCKVRITAAEISSALAESRAPFTILASGEKGYRWEPVSDRAAFAPRDGAGALVFRDKMWLLGGWNPSDKVHFPKVCNSEVWTSTDGATWQLQTHAPWEGRHTAGYAVHDGKMWIVGGDPIQGHYQNDVWNTGDGIHWTRVSDSVPWADRVLHYTVAHREKIWVMGGQTVAQFAPAPDAFYNDVWNTADGVHWTRVTARAPWPPRGMIGGSAVFADRIWILGGGTYDTPKQPQRKFYHDVWSSADGLRWERHVEFAPWQARQYHEVAVFDDRLWVLEGWNRGNRNDVWYSADGINWYELPNTPWAPRHAASVFVHQGALWMVAGNNMRSDVWKLVPSTGAK